MVHAWQVACELSYTLILVFCRRSCVSHATRLHNQFQASSSEPDLVH